MAKFDRMNVATALNSKYMRYAYVMLTSLFCNHPREDIQVYLLHNDLTPYIHYDIEQLWWEYAKMTPFYHELLEEFVAECIRSPLIYVTMNTLSAEKQTLSAELSKSTALCKKLLTLLNK